MLLLFMLLYTGWVEVETTVDTVYNSKGVYILRFVPDSTYFIDDTTQVRIFTDRILKLVSSFESDTFVFKEDKASEIISSDWVSYLWALDLAMRAREGDERVKAMLDFWGIEIQDSNEKIIYPIQNER